MQRMEKEQKSLQAKMKELDANAKRAADIQAAGNGIDGDTQAIVAQQVAAALSEERAKLEHAFKDLESQKAQIAQTLTETEKESKKHQEQLAAQIAQEKAEVDAKIQQMHKEKEEMTSHLALTLKESQSQTRVIQEKMEAEKEDLVRIMQQREQEKLDVLLKLQQTQTKMEVEIIERELLQRTKAEIAAADSKLAPAVAAAEDKQSLEFSLSESKALSPRAIATSVSDAKEAKEGPYQTGKDSVVYTSETKLAQIDAEAASHKAAAEALAQEREQLRLQLQQFAKEKEELAAQLALAERTAKARQDLAAQHANREKEELKAAVQRMREELRLEKEAAAAATTAAREASTGGFNSSGSELGNGVGIAEARGASIAVAEGEQTQTLKPSKSLFNMFEEVNSTNEKPLQLPRTLSKALVQAMPHTIDAIPEGEEGTADVFGIDSDDESAALSRHGSGASLGSRIRREKAIDLKNQAAAKEAAAARQAAEAKSADGTATSTQSTTVAASPTAAAAANSFEDLPAPHAAAASGDLTRLKVLGKLQLSLLSSLDGAQRCPLFYAVAYGQEEVTDYLVEQAPDMVDSVDSHGDTPVHAAASGGNTECVRILLSCKEMRSKERSRKKWERERHSLGKSCTEEDWTAHETQEEHKKDPEVADTRNAMKMTPSHLARTPDVLELLYSYGADMSAVDANGRSPLFVSCAMNRESCTEYIIQCLDRERKTEELYEKDNRGDTPLHAAACNGSVECLLLLLQFGVDPTVANSKGLKAIDLAARNNQTKCRNLLAEYHLHFCTSSEFDSVLFLATLEGHRQVKAAESAGEEASYEIIKKKSSFSGAANAMNGGGGGGLKHVQSMFSLKTNKSLRLQRWGEWIAYEDQQTDKVYWYNSVTSKGQWEKPQSVAKMQMDTAMGTGGGSPGSRQLTSKKSMRLKKYGDWIEYVTDTSQTFFYNEKNGEFQWHAPPGHPKYRADGAASSPQTSVAAAMLAASSSQSPQNETMENQFVDPNDPDAPHGNGKGGGSNNEWQPYKDPDSGSIFWYNSVTHVSQWECPFDDVDFAGPTESTGVTGEKHDSDDDDAQEVLDADDLGI